MNTSLTVCITQNSLNRHGFMKAFKDYEGTDKEGALAWRSRLPSDMLQAVQLSEHS